MGGLDSRFRGNDDYLFRDKQKIKLGGRVGIDIKRGGRVGVMDSRFVGMTVYFDGNGVWVEDTDCFVALLLAMTRGCKDGKGNGLE